MTGNVSIDLSLANIWKSWWLFRRGKERTAELERFTFYLEQNLFSLWCDLNHGTYRHGGYRVFTVTDNKRRTISVASIRDRVVHRLLYEYLVPIFDPTFAFDAWSCRKGKGLIGAIERTHAGLATNPRAFVWRTDIKKFFDSVDQDVVHELLVRRIHDPRALSLLQNVISSFWLPGPSRERERETALRRRGMPIGNLTSQILANIYLNELDRFVMHRVQPLSYVRYGDDFILIGQTQAAVAAWRTEVTHFLYSKLVLEINPKNDILIPTKRGLHFLGVDIYPAGKRLRRRTLMRIRQRTNLRNAASYYGLLAQHGNKKMMKRYNWFLLNKLPHG